MMRLKLVLASFLFFIVGCSTPSRLINITHEYRVVQPEQSRIKIDYEINNMNDPFIKFQLTKEFLSKKVYTKTYEKIRNDKKLGNILVGTLFIGGSVGLFIWNKKIDEKDSSSKFWTFLGGLFAGLYGLSSIVKKTPVETWNIDSVDNKDTKYAFPATIKSKAVYVINNKNKYSYYTDKLGYMTIDIRDFFDKIPAGSPLILSFTDGFAESPNIEINQNYVNQIRRNEDEANSLLEKAKSSISENRYIVAEQILSDIISNYPLTKAKPVAVSLKRKIKDDVVRERSELKIVQIYQISSASLFEAINNAGVTIEELGELSFKLENLDREKILRITKEGLSLSLSDEQSIQYFTNLDNIQKLFAIILTAENFEKISNKAKWLIIMELLDINDSLAKKLAQIRSENITTETSDE